jgi:ABC-type cobalamin transport system ATPase subunit
LRRARLHPDEYQAALAQYRAMLQAQQDAQYANLVWQALELYDALGAPEAEQVRDQLGNADH